MLNCGQDYDIAKGPTTTKQTDPPSLLDKQYNIDTSNWLNVWLDCLAEIYQAIQRFKEGINGGEPYPISITTRVQVSYKINPDTSIKADWVNLFHQSYPTISPETLTQQPGFDSPWKGRLASATRLAITSLAHQIRPSLTTSDIPEVTRLHLQFRFPGQKIRQTTAVAKKIDLGWNSSTIPPIRIENTTTLT